jgi:hypothetical protein
VQHCFDGVELVVSPGLEALEWADRLVLPRAIDAGIFWEDVGGITGQVRMSAGGQDMGDVFVLPEGEDRGRVVLDEVWGLVEEVLGREAVVVAAIDEVVGGLCPGGHEMTAGGQRKKAPVGP